jgi:hypothetical protein
MSPVWTGAENVVPCAHDALVSVMLSCASVCLYSEFESLVIGLDWKACLFLLLTLRVSGCCCDGVRVLLPGGRFYSRFN